MSRESGVSRYVQDTPNGPSSSGTSLPEPPPYTQAEMRQGLSFDGQFYKITDAMWFDANNNPELFVRRFNAALGEDRELSQVLTRVACLDVSSLNNKQSYERILPALLGNDSTSPRPFGEITSIHFGQYRDAAISAGMLDKAKDYAGHPIVVKESDDKRTLSLVDTKMPAPSPQHRIFSDSEGRIPIDEQVAKNKAIDELSAGIESTPRGAVQAAQDPIATEQPKTSPAPTAPAPDAPASPSPAPSALAPEPAASLTADAPGADQDRSALPPAVTPLAQILSGMPPQPVSPVSPAAPSATAQPTPPVSVRDLDHASHASLTSIEGASVEAQSEVGDPVSLMPAAPLASAGREGDIEPLYKVEDLVMGPELRPKYIEGLREQELAAARSASPATASVLGEGTSDVESMSSSAASLTASPLAQAPLSGISPMQAAAGAPSDHTRASAVAGASSSIERWADEVASSVGERDSPVPPITAAVAKAIEL